MRALTVRQPWASLIALGVKRYETRSRPTRVRGRIAIHAGAAAPCRADAPFAVGAFTVWRWDQAYLMTRAAGPGRVDRFSLPLGAVVATAELVDCIPTDDADISDLERALGDWTPRRWAWLLDDVRPLPEPVPAKGKQGWWDWTPEGGA